MVLRSQQVISRDFGEVFHVISRLSYFIQIAEEFLELLPLLHLLGTLQQVPSQQPTKVLRDRSDPAVQQIAIPSATFPQLFYRRQGLECVQSFESPAGGSDFLQAFTVLDGIVHFVAFDLPHLVEHPAACGLEGVAQC